MAAEDVRAINIEVQVDVEHAINWPPDTGLFGAVQIGDAPDLAVGLWVRAGTPIAHQRMFGRWAAGRLERFFADGPDVDGWSRDVVSGNWHTWARLIEMPNLDLE